MNHRRTVAWAVLMFFAPCSPLSLSSLLIKENVCEGTACRSSDVKTKGKVHPGGVRLGDRIALLPPPIRKSPPGMQGTGCLESQQAEHTGEAAWETEKGT